MKMEETHKRVREMMLEEHESTMDCHVAQQHESVWDTMGMSWQSRMCKV